jgi:CubicO group peptidase (beta-lactamase class C family)
LHPSEALREQLSGLVRTAQAEDRLPSVSAPSSTTARWCGQEAVGLADAERGEPVTPDHQYRIGSITKTFTAAAVMQLRDAGALELDDPLVKHVVESSHPGPTLRRLLAHLSGLQREIPRDDRGEVVKLYWATYPFTRAPRPSR